jgi:hypothetical protein
MKEVTDEVAQLIAKPVSEETGGRDAVPDDVEEQRPSGRISLDPGNRDAEREGASERTANKIRG